MTCLHNHDQILEFLWKIFLKGFQIYQNYLCALNVTPSLTLILILFITLPQAKNPIITITLFVRDIIAGAIVAGANVGSPSWLHPSLKFKVIILNDLL